MSVDMVQRLKLIRARKHRNEREIEQTIEELDLVIRELENLQCDLHRQAMRMKAET